MTFKQALTTLIEKRDLGQEDMLELMHQIMTGQLTPVQIAGILIALRAKGETVTEIAAAAQVMRELATRVPVAPDEHLVDTCGTGGDGAHTFNISTASAIVAAAAGVKVAKHGGRSVSSTCGSADVLEALGVNVNLTPEDVAAAIREIGVGFMFAPNYHSAMRYAAPVRRELGVRTLFNLLGPLTNPAGAKNQVMGVFARDLVPKLARVLQALGSRHVMVVHAADGLDEISLGRRYLRCRAQGRLCDRIHPHPPGLRFRSLPLGKTRGAQHRRGRGDAAFRLRQCGWPGAGHRLPQRRRRSVCGRRGGHPGRGRGPGAKRHRKRRGQGEIRGTQGVFPAGQSKPLNHRGRGKKNERRASSPVHRVPVGCGFGPGWRGRVGKA
jgi:anthranilate phosphoribosyltransferase